MKRQSYNIPGHAHYLTFTCFHRLQLLTNDSSRIHLVHSIDQARRRHHFQLWAWVIMPEHVHLLIHPGDEEHSVSEMLKGIKGPAARRIIADWREQNSLRLRSLRVTPGGREYYRFWQEGGGFDRNLRDMDRISKAIEYIEFNPVRRGLVASTTDWRWSSAQGRSGANGAVLPTDQIEFEGEWTGERA